MFSYLRPSSRRHGAPAPTSPAASTESFFFPPNPPLWNRNDNASVQSSSPISPVPPILPPIPRIASRHGTDKATDDSREARQQIWTTTPQEESKQHALPLREGTAATKEAERRPSQGAEVAFPPIPSIIAKPPRSQRVSINDISITPSQNQVTNSAHPHQLRQAFHKAKQLSTTAIPQGRQGKARLNLLNPMALLARRRSSLAISQPFLDRYSLPNSLIVPGMNLPDDYDPRIRGNVVHDFSAPRPKRYLSSIDTRSPSANNRFPSDGDEDPTNSQDHDSQSTDQPSLGTDIPMKGSEGDIAEREISPPEHTPIFKEHFEDDVEPMPDDFGASGTKCAAAFLYQVSVTQSAQSSLPLPPFAKPVSRSLTPMKPSSTSQSQPSSRECHSEMYSEATQASKLPLAPVPETKTPPISPLPVSSVSTPPISPPQRRSRTFSSTESTPKHMKSNASRFSFDLAGVGSATQERLLEEKHRQKAAQRARISTTSALETEGGRLDGEDDNDFYDEDTDGDDGIEERIPGVNADAEEDTFTEPRTHQYNFLSSIQSSHSSPVSPMSSEYISSDVPRDSEGQPVGFTVSEVSPDVYYPVDLQTDQNHTSGSYTHLREAESVASCDQSNIRQQFASKDDELYFDDGIIEDFDEEDGPAFDESVFDDDSSRIYGLPLRDLKPLPLMEDYPTHEERQLPISSDDQHVLDESVNDASLTSNVEIGAIGPKPSLVDRSRHDKPVFNKSAELTRDNLAAFHNALAFAANQAPVPEEFTQQQRSNATSPDLALQEYPSLTSSTNVRIVGASECGVHFDNNLIDERCYVELDDMAEDDAIIAAANAEALENDDEGFYGQEFGFFARAADSGDAQYSNGGYFGPRGIEGVKRSCSGRANFQEPSLTPITERSEWSNRNSMISQAMQHGYAQPTHTLPSPNVTHLADIMHLEDDGSMSLSALMKLRRGTWGGSNASLQSSSAQSQISGSPINYLPPMMPTGTPITGNGISTVNLASSDHSFTGSNHSLGSSNSVFPDDDSNPTITIQTQGLFMAPYMQSQYSHSSASSDVSPVKRGPPWQKGHRRSSSSTESVSYLRVGDEEGGRWVLEKRRMLDGGGMEVLGREVVEGGRI